MHSTIAVGIILLQSVSATAGGAGQLSGTWEVQSMGANREIIVRQKGDKIIAHRVMWPTFEGEKYKLEHLYRGTIMGKTIRGQLLVKEDELPKYEVLRDFQGSVASVNRIILDGLPLMRSGKEASKKREKRAKEKEMPKVPAQERTSPPPSYSKKDEPAATPPASLAKTEKSQVATAKPKNQDDVGSASASLFQSIMSSSGLEDLNLFQISNTITIPNPVADLTDEGDTLYAKRKYKKALGRYEEAAKISKTTHVELMHRMGRCQIKLKRFAPARRLLRKALRLDPNNPLVLRDYERARARRG